MSKERYSDNQKDSSRRANYLPPDRLSWCGDPDPFRLSTEDEVEKIVERLRKRTDVIAAAERSSGGYRSPVESNFFLSETMIVYPDGNKALITPTEINKILYQDVQINLSGKNFSHLGLLEQKPRSSLLSLREIPPSLWDYYRNLEGKIIGTRKSLEKVIPSSFLSRYTLASLPLQSVILNSKDDLIFVIHPRLIETIIVTPLNG